MLTQILRHSGGLSRVGASILAASLGVSVAATQLPVSSDMRACQNLLDERAQGAAPAFDPARPTVVLVDGYSSGRFFPRAFRDAGLQVVHVHAQHRPPENLKDSFWPGTYEMSFAHDENDFEGLIERLSRLEVRAVIPGTDTGVLFADRIAAALRRRRGVIPSNGEDRARKDKAEMQDRLAASGLGSIRQIATADVEEALRWVRDHGLLDGSASAVVVKPLMSAGGEGVYFPTSEDGIREAFGNILGHDDGLGYLNARALVQELITGVEYVPNSTVWDGKVVYTDIWEYHKRKTATGRWIYDYDVLLPFEGDVQRRLREYDREVLKALGIRFGNSHSEIMMVDGRGPVLIETNNRPMGASQPAFAKFATGRSQIDLTALAVSDPEAFARLPEGYDIRKNAIVFTIANLYGRDMRLDPKVRETLRGLPGYFRDSLHVQPGEISRPTEDMFSQIGEVWLLHEDAVVLQTTVDRLHEMERDGTFFARPFSAKSLVRALVGRLRPGR